MPRRKDSDLRERLIHAASAVFAEQGFGAAGMHAIGHRAGVTKGGVYFHFRSKEELFFAVVDHWRGALRERLAAAERRGISAAEHLRGYLREYLAFHFDQPAAASLLRVLAAELRGRFTAQVREDMRGAHRALRSRIRELLTLGAKDGSLFSGDPAFTAFLLASALRGVVSQWLESARDAEPFCHADALADALVAPYATGPGPPDAVRTETVVPPGSAEAEDYRPPF